MRCSVFYLAVSAFAALAAADSPNPFNIPTNGYTFKVGSPTTLTWNPTTSGTVTLRLLWGAVTTADSGETIASGIANSGSYTWTPSTNLASEPDYTIEIIDDSNSSEYNYLPRFVVEGATASASASTASSTATTTTSSSSSASSSSSVTSTTLSTSTTSSASSSSSPSSSSASTTSSSSRSSSSAAASTTSTEASSTTSAASSTATTKAPNANAGAAVKVPAGLLALVMGVVAAF